MQRQRSSEFPILSPCLRHSGARGIQRREGPLTPVERGELVRVAPPDDAVSSRPMSPRMTPEGRDIPTVSTNSCKGLRSRRGGQVLEIGPGTGQATGRLLDYGATVTAVELGPEMAAALEAKFGGRDLSVLVGAFEEAPLDPESFDLIVAATSFHWVPPETGLPLCADLLRPGGWLALWWTYYGDPDRPDPFRDALEPIFEELAPSLIETFPGLAFAGAHPYALDIDTASPRSTPPVASGRCNTRSSPGRAATPPPSSAPVRLVLPLPRPPARRPHPGARRHRTPCHRHLRRPRRTALPHPDLPRAASGSTERAI